MTDILSKLLLLFKLLASCVINFMGILPHPRICNFIDSLINWVCLFTESYLPDTENIVPFANTTPINQNKKVKIKKRKAG